MTLYFFIGEEVAKAERLKSQMITNLEMARDRVTNLCKYISCPIIIKNFKNFMLSLSYTA